MTDENLVHWHIEAQVVLQGEGPAYRVARDNDNGFAIDVVTVAAPDERAAKNLATNPVGPVGGHPMGMQYGPTRVINELSGDYKIPLQQFPCSLQAPYTEDWHNDRQFEALIQQCAQTAAAGHLARLSGSLNPDLRESLSVEIIKAVAEAPEE